MFLLTALAASASEQKGDVGVDFFEGTFKEALEQAKQEDSPLFVDLSIPECASCEFMATKVYTDSKVGEFINARFVSFKLDAYDEEANGPVIAQRYSVGSFPTYLILDPDGNERHRASGSMNSDAFIRSISWLTGETTSPMVNHDSRYESGDRDSDFVQQYLLDSILELKLMPRRADNWEEDMEALSNAESKYKAIANEYFESKSQENLVNSTDFTIIGYYCIYRKDKGFEFVINNFGEYVDATSLERVSNFVLNVITDNAFILAKQGDPTYVELVDLLEEEPLIEAAAFERSLDPESPRLPENQRDHLAETFASGTQDSEE
ncbi:MAG: DUF255 domain-containing protein [Gammaproteobacteria bacterium]|nr:DUF255 domain-containing protein [Gammaproteobacteria bacterium]